MENHLETCKVNCEINTLWKACNSDAKIKGASAWRCEQLYQQSFVCLTEPAWGIKWVFVESWTQKRKRSFPISEQVFMHSVPFRFIWENIRKPLCYYSQLCLSALLYHFLLPIYTILCLLHGRCAFQLLLLHDTVNYATFLRFSLNLSLEGCFFLPWLQFFQ